MHEKKREFFYSTPEKTSTVPVFVEDLNEQTLDDVPDKVEDIVAEVEVGKDQEDRFDMARFS